MLAGCGGSSSPAPATTPGVRTAPDLHAFLQQPVATPTACPSGVNGSASGRRSPWVGHVDVSVFLATSASARRRHDIGATLRRASLVQQVYFESQAKAYAEYQRLYTCWASVPRSQTPASFRVVLVPTTTLGKRNAFVARLVRRPGVDSVSCDPSLPCTNVVRSASPQ